MGNIGKFWVLPGPKPVFVAIYAYTGLISANDKVCGNALFDLLVGRFCFPGKTLEQLVNSTFTNLKPKDITEHFFHPGKRKVLPCIEVTNKALGAQTVAYGRTK
jgi:hypothetical protein